MPLPDGSQPKMKWPPVIWHNALDQMEEHAAWFSGSADQLAHVYGGTVTFTDKQPWWRFWARTPERTTQRGRAQLHMPLAGDIAGTSASLLFSESPQIEIPEAHGEMSDTNAEHAEARLHEIIDAISAIETFTEAAEIAAALGGVYLRVGWDKRMMPDSPNLTPVHPDHAVPEFQHRRLSAITIWRVVHYTQTKVWRHLERHEPGRIYNGLFEGDQYNLGRRIDLSASTETRDLDEEVLLPPALRDTILVRYVPNIRPNRRFRTGPASNLGRSDFAGAEDMLNALDETWTSWMRDIRLGRSRIMVPEEYLEITGDAVKFDLDQEVFTPLAMGPGDDRGITAEQFAIRVDEHSRTVHALTRGIINNAGYNAQTFGLDIQGQAESGTALRIRERKSLITQQKKRSFWEPKLADVLWIMLAVDREVLGKRTAIYRPVVTMADSIAEDPQHTATIIELLNRAEAVSTKIKVAMAHPEWSQERIDAEAEVIDAERGRIVEDPFQMGSMV